MVASIKQGKQPILSSDRNSDIVRAFLIGGVFGAAAGILLSTKGGRASLENIFQRTATLLTKVERDYDKAVETVRKSYETITRCREELVSGVGAAEDTAKK